MSFKDKFIVLKKLTILASNLHFNLFLFENFYTKFSLKKYVINKTKLHFKRLKINKS